MSTTISADTFNAVVRFMGDVAASDIAWTESVSAPTDAEFFARETIFVICNSGMRFTVAQGIFRRCMQALYAGDPVIDVFKHKGKVGAIERIWADRHALFAAYLAAADQLQFLADLPWIGGITKYHLAKNFGLDVAKPDVHMQRLADREGCTVQALCERLAAATGYRIATVDTVLWRACATGVINSRTGAVAV